ncbi:response regulator [Desulfopila aestuarii]|uniref:Cytidylate kinase-like family protein n=1 Tax=Desulfopila aestuarii DSM 18488 TaxID=1121416 RepID=A0A1M7Y920_9BACT|nr:response regulator [Desulfopila aestuarii]SHO49135.1 Cytidylate kinase-like family protein [Desulfopila aestuarii DSM 18488]
MSSIAIFPCTFTPADTIIHELAKTLELEVYDDEHLLADTARKHGLNIEKLNAAMYNKTSVFNQFTLERERAINLFKSELADRLESPKSYLFHGFLTSLISSRLTHVLKVLVVDSRQERIAHAVESGLTEREAKKAVKAHDIKAYNWTDFLFKKEAYDSSLFDLVIPVEGKSPAEVQEVIVKCLHTTSVLRTPESMAAVGDYQIEVEVEKLLLNGGHRVVVDCQGGDVTLTVEKSVFNFSKLATELTDLAGKVGGVKRVHVEKSVNYNDSIYRQQKFELPSKVLFVDDEKDFVQTVSERLISRDVGTYGVFNGEEALELIADDQPDVMVLDLKMPGLNGVEVLRRTKEVAPDVEVIILTGHGTSQDMRECMELGAFAYMNKPVDIEELSATIKAANDKVHKKS